MVSASSQTPLSRKDRRRQAKLTKKTHGGRRGKDLQTTINTALECHRHGKLAEAAAGYKKALKGPLDSTLYARIASNLGAILKDIENPEAALVWHQRAIKSDPYHAAAHSNLGITFKELGRIEDALTALHQAIVCDPNLADAHSNIGTIYEEQGDAQQAVTFYQRALAINPAHAGTHYNLGNVYNKIDRNYEKAVTAYQAAITASPNFIAAYNNMGAALQSLDRLEDAQACYKHALTIEPNFADTRLNIALAQLALGEIGVGWDNHEQRWESARFPSSPRNFPQPRWNGEPLRDKSILLWGEQGIGDEILFANTISDVIAAGGLCAIECAPRLVKLFARSFPQAEVHACPYTLAETGAKNFDYQIPMGSLPRYLRPSLDSFPKHDGYLKADQERKRFWQQRLSDLGPGLKVGIAWRSAKMSHDRNVFFAKIADMAPLMALDNVTFVNLQYDDCAEEIAEAKERLGITLHCWEDVDLKNDLDEAAALTSNLDVVITAYTSVANMAGALGVPTYSFVPDQRYWISMGDDQVPWLPAVRLFRQTEPGEWNGVFQEIARALRAWCKKDS